MQKTRLMNNDLTSHENHNILWDNIKYYANYCFGKLATLIWGKLQNDDLLIECFIEKFQLEDYRSNLRKLLEEHMIDLDTKLFSDFTATANIIVHTNFINEFQDFLNIQESNDSSRLISIVGNKGIGKTTLISYFLKTLPENKFAITITLEFINDIDQIEAEKKINSEIYISLIEQVDKKVFYIANKQKIQKSDIPDYRFKEELELVDSIINPNDDSEEKKLKRTRRSQVILRYYLSKQKENYESIMYVKTGIDFIKSYDIQVLLILDDFDKVKNKEIAKKIINDVREIANALEIHVLFASRTITMHKINDSLNDIRYYLNPPSFEEVLLKRIDVFINQIKSVNQSELIRPKNEIIRLFSFIARNIINNDNNLYLIKLLSNSNIDKMLSFFRAILSSPRLTNKIIDQIMEGNYIFNDHKLLDFLLLYSNQQYVDDNTHIINMYNSSKPLRTNSLDNLFRIRIIQIILTFGKSNIHGQKYLEMIQLVRLLKQIGYDDMIGIYLNNTLKIFEDFGLIDTSVFGYKYKDNTEIILLDAAYYYVNHLIYKFRYLQTIIPDTIVNYQPNESAFYSNNLRLISNEIYRFHSFIKDCENEESRYILNSITYDRILDKNGIISEQISRKINEEERRMHHS